MSQVDYTIIDNFFPNEVCYDLREYALDLKIPIDNQFSDYISKEFDTHSNSHSSVSYTHLTLPTNREV